MKNCKDCGIRIWTLHGRMWSDENGDMWCSPSTTGLHMPEADDDSA